MSCAACVPHRAVLQFVHKHGSLQAILQCLDAVLLVGLRQHLWVIILPDAVCTRCMHGCMKLLSDVCLVAQDAAFPAIHCQTPRLAPQLLSALHINTAALHAKMNVGGCP